jgi:hypothetical protein
MGGGTKKRHTAGEIDIEIAVVNNS